MECPQLKPAIPFTTIISICILPLALFVYCNMVRWIFAPGTMHFRPRYDTFWPCGLFTLLQFCKQPPPPPLLKSSWNPDEKFNRVGQWVTRFREIWAGWFHSVAVPMYNSHRKSWNQSVHDCYEEVSLVLHKCVEGHQKLGFQHEIAIS